MVYSISDLMPGIKNAMTCLNVQPGEEAVILYDTATDPLVVEAFASGLRYNGATLTRVLVDPVMQGGLDSGKFPNAVDNAIMSTDIAVALTMYPLHHSALGDKLETGVGLKKGKENYRLRYMDLIGMANAYALRIAGRFPTPLFWEVMKRTMKKLSEGKTLKFIDKKRATELTAIIRHQEYSPLGPRTRAMQKGEFLPWPYGAWVTHDMIQCSGTISWDGAVPFGLFNNPIRLHISNGEVQKFEGGREAELLLEYVGGYKNYNYVAELGIGLNPWSRSYIADQSGTHEVTRRTGNCLLAVGAGHVPERYSSSHLDGLILNQEVFVNDEPFVTGGKVVVYDDPELREIASNYGDPDLLFSHEGYRSY